MSFLPRKPENMKNKLETKPVQLWHQKEPCEVNVFSESLGVPGGLYSHWGMVTTSRKIHWNCHPQLQSSILNFCKVLLIVNKNFGGKKMNVFDLQITFSNYIADGRFGESPNLTKNYILNNYICIFFIQKYDRCFSFFNLV